MDRGDAVDRVIALLEMIERDPMPVPITEVWVFGELALGLDPISRLDIYLAKDMLFAGAAEPEREEAFRDRMGVRGIGTTVDATWANAFPEHVRANDAGYAAPERCLAAHLLEENEPIHLEICNAGFESNVTQRLRGAQARKTYEEILDPRGVCVWANGTRSETATGKLREGAYVFPTLAEALEMIGLDETASARAAEAVREWQANRDGVTVRGDVV